MPEDRTMHRMDRELEEKDEAYFEGEELAERSFDTRLLREPTSVLPVRKPLALSRFHSVTDAIRAMQSEHCGVVLVSEDGTLHSRVVGIFTVTAVNQMIIDGYQHQCGMRYNTSIPAGIHGQIMAVKGLPESLQPLNNLRHIKLLNLHGHSSSFLAGGKVCKHQFLDYRAGHKEDPAQAHPPGLFLERALGGDRIRSYRRASGVLLVYSRNPGGTGPPREGPKAGFGEPVDA